VFYARRRVFLPQNAPKCPDPQEKLTTSLPSSPRWIKWNGQGKKEGDHREGQEGGVEEEEGQWKGEGGRETRWKFKPNCEILRRFSWSCFRRSQKPSRPIQRPWNARIWNKPCMNIWHKITYDWALIIQPGPFIFRPRPARPFCWLYTSWKTWFPRILIFWKTGFREFQTWSLWKEQIIWNYHTVIDLFKRTRVFEILNSECSFGSTRPGSARPRGFFWPVWLSRFSRPSLVWHTQ